MFNTLARLAAHRHRLVLALSVALLLGLAVLASGAFATLKSGGFDDPSSDSSRASALVDDRFGGETNLVLLLTPAAGASLDAPAVTAAADRIQTGLRRNAGVSSVESYWSSHAAALRSRDGASGLITMHVTGDDDASADAATTIIDAYATSSPDVTVRAGGELGVGNDIGTQVGKDLGIAETIAVPITLVLLVLAFGSLLAALLPLAIGLFAVAGTFAELAVIGHLTDVSIYAVNLTTALGLGLAIDYSLLIVNRFREELNRGADVEGALRTTLRTAGRTIVFSSATVAVALAALLIFPLYFLRSFAYAGIGVVLIAMLAALITLPALLGALGQRVIGRGQRRRADALGASASVEAESAAWRRIATTMMRRPLAVALPVIAVLLVMGVPLLHISFATPDDRVLPTSVASRQVGDVLRADYGGDAASASYVVLQGSAATADVDRYAASISRLAGVNGVRGAAGVWTDGTFAPAAADGFVRGDAQYLQVSGPADTTASTSQDLIHAIRDMPVPPGNSALVGGRTAALVDGKAAIGGRLPWALLWIALTTFLLLFLFTGSLLLPVKALVLNAISLSAVFGAIVWIFQDGHLASVIGFTPTPINTSMPVLLFCVAFGLSMDYEVFLLSRIKEVHDGGAGTTEAVASGLARTGRIVTTAAALLSVTFFAFGLGKTSFIQLFGIGTGLAIVLDATVIRGLLVPAFMRVAGEWNWWAPAPLRRLHQRIGLSEAAPESVTREPVPVG